MFLNPSYSVVMPYFPASKSIGTDANPFLSVFGVYVFPLALMVTFLFGDALPLLFRILTVNLLPSPSFMVRSLVTISDLIVIVFVTLSDVFGFAEVIAYFPGFRSMASLATPFLFVLTEYVLLFSLNLMPVFFRRWPFLS